MKKKINKKKRRGRIIGLGILLILLVFLSIGKRGFIQQIKIKREQKKLKQEIAQLGEKKEQLQKEKDKLDDPEHIEKVAREKYGMAKKNEKVYHVVPKNKKSGK